MKSLQSLCAIVLIVLFSSCSHWLVNDQKKDYDKDFGYRYLPTDSTISQDSIYVILAFSGGGTRAAALSYGVMEKLRNTPIKDGTSTLLNEVDLISSVSGGSFTSAYYGLFGNQIFTDFKDKFLYRDIQDELMGALFNPVNWFKLISPEYNRIDLAINLYNETIFREKTFQDLVNRGRRPFIALNATNLTTGSQFTFTQPIFDILGSNLSTMPVARGVAASSAFPFLLSPVSLKNWPASNGFVLNQDIQHGLNDGYGGLNPRRYMWAYNMAIYNNDKSKHKYLHLMDGGLSDNIGVRYIIDNFQHSSGFIFPRKSRIKELVIIMVNARTQPSESIDKSETPPDILDVAYKTATVSMDNYSFESVQLISEIFQVSARDAEMILQCQAILDANCNSGYKIPKINQDFEVTAVEVNFLNVKDEAKRKELLNLPTSFSLSRKQVDLLVAVGEELLEQSKPFNELANRLK